MHICLLTDIKNKSVICKIYLYIFIYILYIFLYISDVTKYMIFIFILFSLSFYILHSLVFTLLVNKYASNIIICNKLNIK